MRKRIQFFTYLLPLKREKARMRVIVQKKTSLTPTLSLRERELFRWLW